MTLLNNEKRRLRISYGIAFAILFVIEGLIALFVHDAFIRPYVGDVLVMVVLYCLVRIIIPVKYKLLPLYIFFFATVVECLQYLKLVRVLGLESNTFLYVLIGSTFDTKDIMCYGIGFIILELYDWQIRRKQ